MASPRIPARIRPALQELQKRLKQRLGHTIALILFGSYARGDATWESDVDICLVLPRHDPQLFLQALDIAWEVGFQHGLVISLLPITFQELQLPGDMLPIAEVIREEGIPI